MGSERDECSVTIDGIAPALVVLFRRAAAIAAEHGRTWVGVEDLYAALAEDERAPLWWPRVGKPRRTRGVSVAVLSTELPEDTVPLSYNEFRDLVNEWIPGPTPEIGPEDPATVTYQISGPHAEEFTAMIERS
ncbi:hypothetical protein ACFYTQ_05370 [Nocardia sp. NPDC004068]|uniref:hypothetical protein n=1 Tax=Nocardia sp. NPDC004068 TaxID=3364303 RepID=UPI0036A30D9C